jgi:hypothetical protein
MNAIIDEFPQPLVFQTNLVGNDALILVQRVRSLEQALELASLDEGVRSFLDEEEGVSVLQETLAPLNEWRKFDARPVPVATSLSQYLEIYKNYYVSSYLFEMHSNWLAIVHGFRDYYTLAKIVEEYENEIEPEDYEIIHENMKAYPLSVFSDLWYKIGTEQDLISVLSDQNLSEIEKEKRLLPVLNKIELERESHLTLLRLSLKLAPRVFELLYTKKRELGGSVLREEILVVKITPLAELRNIKKGLFLVLEENEAKDTVVEFGERLVWTRMDSEYGQRQRQIAWTFLIETTKPSKEFLLELKRRETPDNKLWLREKLKTI